MRNVFVALIVLMTWPGHARAQNVAEGERVYKQHCARCHDGAMPRMPTRDALRKFTPEAIDNSLSSFAMRRQGAALRPAERRAVAEYLSGAPSGSYRAPLDVISKSAYCDNNTVKPSAAVTSGNAGSGAGWNGWGVNF